MDAFIVIAGGGTGGHVFPALAVAEELRRRHPSLEILLLGAERGLEVRVVPAAGFPLRTLRLSGLAGRSVLARLVALWRSLLAAGQCLALFHRSRPAVVVGVGGFASAPALVAASLLRIRTLIHEQNAIAGITNRWLAPFASRIAVSFPGSEATFRGRGVVTGNPIRKSFFEIAPHRPRTGTLRVLIFGGSRGASSLTRAAVAALPLLEDLKHRLTLVLQTGEADHAEASASCRRSALDVTVLSFIEDMPARLEAADLVVCRAGAGTIFELAAAGRASILVPYPHAAGGHQEKNAGWLERQGAAVVVADGSFTGERLAGLLREAVEAPEALAARGSAARALARPRAASDIADMIEQLIAGARR